MKKYKGINNSRSAVLLLSGIFPIQHHHLLGSVARSSDSSTDIRSGCGSQGGILASNPPAWTLELGFGGTNCDVFSAPWFSTTHFGLISPVAEPLATTLNLSNRSSIFQLFVAQTPTQRVAFEHHPHFPPRLRPTNRVS